MKPDEDLLSRIPDHKLLAGIAGGEVSDPTVRQRLGELWERHSAWLLRYCRKRYSGRFPNEHDLQDLVTDSFLALPRAAKRFDPTRVQGQDPSGPVRKWLTKLARWTFLKRVRISKNDPHQFVDPQRRTDCWKRKSTTGGPSDGDRRIHFDLIAGFSNLSKREQAILQASASYVDERSGEIVMPEERRRQLRDAWEIRDDAHLRKIRSRAMEKLRRLADLPRAVTA